jgi:hypothetical protein
VNVATHVRGVVGGVVWASDVDTPIRPNNDTTATAAALFVIG